MGGYQLKIKFLLMADYYLYGFCFEIGDKFINDFMYWKNIKV